MNAQSEAETNLDFYHRNTSEDSEAEPSRFRKHDTEERGKGHGPGRNQEGGRDGGPGTGEEDEGEEEGRVAIDTTSVSTKEG